MKYKCPVCHKLTAGRQARDGWVKGDGTWVFPRRHKINGKLCEGTFMEAEWIDTNEQKTKKKS